MEGLTSDPNVVSQPSERFLQMLKFITSTNVGLLFSVNPASSNAAEIREAAPKVVSLTADGPEKKMIARAGIRFPRLHGPVTLPDQMAKLVAFNLAAIVEAYAPKQKNDAAPEDDTNEGDDTDE